MPSPSSFLTLLAESRLDTVLFGLVLLIGYASCRRYLRRRSAAEFESRTTLPVVVGLFVTGALTADATRLIIDYPALADAAALLGARSIVWTLFIAVTLVLLGSAVRLALLRAELAAHAETERLLQAAKSGADESGTRAAKDAALGWLSRPFSGGAEPRPAQAGMPVSRCSARQ